jgi:hypothetical protein
LTVGEYSRRNYIDKLNETYFGVEIRELEDKNYSDIRDADTFIKNYIGKKSHFEIDEFIELEKIIIREFWNSKENRENRTYKERLEKLLDYWKDNKNRFIHEAEEYKRNYVD